MIAYVLVLVLYGTAESNFDYMGPMNKPMCISLAKQWEASSITAGERKAFCLAVNTGESA